MNEKTAISERRWVMAWALLIVVLSSLPYLFGLRITPPGYEFLGLTHNIDDGAVYLSWMRQAADGHFFIRNLFTSDPQPAKTFNLLFLLMGWTSRLSHLPLIVVFHLYRVGLAVALLFAAHKYSRVFLDKPEQHRILIPLLGLSAGVGWMLPGAGAPSGPVDNWQPEAITFLSIYLNPLFLAGLILMVGAFYWLVLAQRTGQVGYAIYAGLCLLALGNVHTYDVITVAAVWTLYLVVLGIAERRFPTRVFYLSVLAAIIAVPSVAYQFYLYRIDEVFRARANSPIPSPPVWSFFAGYGLVLVCAFIGAWLLVRTSRRDRSLLLLVWAVIGFAVPYLPFAQQRKLIMGIHIPLCILAAYALARLMTAVASRVLGVGLVALIICITAISNVRFIARDISLLAQGRTVTHYAPYISDDDVAAYNWLRANARPGDSVLAPPTFALFTPAFAGVEVYYGHWSETPDYAAKLHEWMALVDADMPRQAKIEIIKSTNARYYVVTGRDVLSEANMSQDLLPDAGFERGDVVIYTSFPGRD